MFAEEQPLKNRLSFKHLDLSLFYKKISRKRAHFNPKQELGHPACLFLQNLELWF